MGWLNHKYLARIEALEAENRQLRTQQSELEAALQEKTRALEELAHQVDGESALNALMGFENRQLKAGLGIVQSDLAGSVESAKGTLACATNVRSNFEGLSQEEKA